MKWVISWTEEFEGQPSVIQADETEGMKAFALVASLMADEGVSQINVIVEQDNGRTEA